VTPTEPYLIVGLFLLALNPNANGKEKNPHHPGGATGEK